MHEYRADDFKCKLSPRAMHAISALLTPTSDDAPLFMWMREWDIIDQAFYSNQHMVPALEFLNSEEYHLTMDNCPVDDFLPILFSDGTPLVFYEPEPSEHLIPAVVQHFLQSTAPVKFRSLTITSENESVELCRVWEEAYSRFFSCPNCDRSVHEGSRDCNGAASCATYFKEHFHIDNQRTAQRLTVVILFNTYRDIIRDGHRKRKYRVKNNPERFLIYIDDARCGVIAERVRGRERPLFSQPEVFVEILSYLERVDVDKCMLLHFSASELIRHYGHGMAKHRLLVSFYHWDEDCVRVYVCRIPQTSRYDAIVDRRQYSMEEGCGRLDMIPDYLRNSFLENTEVSASTSINPWLFALLVNRAELLDNVKMGALELKGRVDLHEINGVVSETTGLPTTMPLSWEHSLGSLLQAVEPVPGRRLKFRMSPEEFHLSFADQRLLSMQHVQTAGELIITVWNRSDFPAVIFPVWNDFVFALPQCNRLLIRFDGFFSANRAADTLRDIIERFRSTPNNDRMAAVFDLEVTFMDPIVEFTVPGKPVHAGLRHAFADWRDVPIRRKKISYDVYHYKSRVNNEWLTAIVKHSSTHHALRLQRGKWEPVRKARKSGHHQNE